MELTQLTHVTSRSPVSYITGERCFGGWHIHIVFLALFEDQKISKNLDPTSSHVNVPFPVEKPV